jgi:hypothetical protein
VVYGIGHDRVDDKAKKVYNYRSHDEGGDIVVELMN